MPPREEADISLSTQVLNCSTEQGGGATTHVYSEHAGPLLMFTLSSTGPLLRSTLSSAGTPEQTPYYLPPTPGHPNPMWSRINVTSTIL